MGGNIKPDADPPKAPESKPGLKSGGMSDAKDDLKSLPLAEVEEKLDSSPDGLTQWSIIAKSVFLRNIICKACTCASYFCTATYRSNY